MLVIMMSFSIPDFFLGDNKEQGDLPNCILFTTITLLSAVFPALIYPSMAREHLSPPERTTWISQLQSCLPPSLSCHKTESLLLSVVAICSSIAALVYFRRIFKERPPEEGRSRRRQTKAQAKASEWKRKMPSKSNLTPPNPRDTRDSTNYPRRVRQAIAEKTVISRRDLAEKPRRGWMRDGDVARHRRNIRIINEQPWTVSDVHKYVY